MDERNYWTRMMGSRISRRGALRGAGIGAAGLAGAALIGCGDDDDDDHDDDAGGGTSGGAGASPTPTAVADPNAVQRGGNFRQATITVAPHFSTLHPGADPSYINTFRRQNYYRMLWHNNGGLGLGTDDLITMDLAESIERSSETEVIVKVKNVPWQNQPKSDSNDAVGQRNYDALDTVERRQDDPNGASDFDITMTVYLAYHHATSQTASFWNNGSLEDAEIDDVVMQINQTLDAEERSVLSHQFERLLAEKAANFVPLLTTNLHVGYYGYVQGANFTNALDGVSNTLQRDLWLAQDA